MRWEDERYVRLYTRDTVTWKRLPWQGKALLPLLLRKADRTGGVDLDGDIVDGVSALTDLPPEVVAPGLDALLGRGVVVQEQDRLVFPNFIAAQEAKASDRLRAQDYRDRQKAVTHRDDASRSVMDRHAPSPIVTNRHTASRVVTPSLAQPSLANPSSGGGLGGPDPSPPASGGPAQAGLPTEIPTDETPKPARAKRARAVAQPDAIPMPGTAERALYDAIVRDALLRPIVVNPGDFAARMVDRFPSIDLVAVTKDAGEWLGRAARTYTDGRGFLRNQYERAAALHAARPKPAPEPEGADPWKTARWIEAPRKELSRG